MSDISTTLKALDNNKLIDIVKNYKQYGYDQCTRSAAISILEERGFSTQDLKMTGNFENQKFEEANMYYDSFFKNSKIALVSYILIFLSNIIPEFITSESNSILTLSVALNWISVIVYLVFLIKSLLDHNKLYKLIGNEYKTNGTTMYYVLGAPFYFILYFVFKKQIYNEMKTIQ